MKVGENFLSISVNRNFKNSVLSEFGEKHHRTDGLQKKIKCFIQQLMKALVTFEQRVLSQLERTWSEVEASAHVAAVSEDKTEASR